MANRVYSTLIKTSALRSLLDSKVPVTVIDASYNITSSKDSPKDKHFQIRIPGSKFFELDEIADKSSGLPHMMPSDLSFISYMKKLKIKNNNHLLLCYDQKGMISSPRVWFTYKIFGKQNVAVLDGGLPKWIAEGHPTETGEYELYSDESSEKDTEYNFKLQASKIKSFDDIKEISEKLVRSTNSVKYQILDARSSGRFNGTDPDPRKNLRSGSIPGSINSFFQQVFNNDKAFKQPEELRKLFESVGVNFHEDINIINSCGSGLTACINLFALELAGKKNTSLYDGSWMEWGARVKA